MSSIHGGLAWQSIQSSDDASLSTAMDSRVISAATTSRDDLQALLDSGGSANACDEAGNSALLYACGKGQTECAQLLLSRKADVNLRADSGATPLLVACNSNHPSCVMLLLKARCNTTYTYVGMTHGSTMRPRTALEWATALGHEECAALLRADDQQRSVSCVVL